MQVCGRGNQNSRTRVFFVFFVFLLISWYYFPQLILKTKQNPFFGKNDDSWQNWGARDQEPAIGKATFKTRSLTSEPA